MGGCQIGRLHQYLRAGKHAVGFADLVPLFNQLYRFALSPVIFVIKCGPLSGCSPAVSGPFFCHTAVWPHKVAGRHNNELRFFFAL